MALSKLDNLYRQVILDHSSHPHHHGELTSATNTIEMRNPTCGDVIQLQLVVENDVIKDAAFSGDGCTISKASSSMMTDEVIGKTIEEATQMAGAFSEMVMGDTSDDTEELLGDAAILSGVAKFPARIKCATLPWKALNNALNKQNEMKASDEEITRGEK